LPTLGAPISAMNPQRACSPLRPFAGTTSPTACSRKDAWDARRLRLSTIEAVGFDAGARQHGGGGGLFGGALGAAQSLGRRQVGKLDGDAEFRIVVGTLALDLAIGRGRQPARLRPLLQHGFRIAQRPRRRAHALAPQSLDERRRGRISAVDEHPAHHRLPNVAAHAPAAARVRLRCPEPDRRAEVDRPPYVRASLLAHEIGEPTRHFAFIGSCEGAKQHVGDDEAEHVIAEKFEPLVGGGAVARPAQRRNVGERLFEQRAILETVPDALPEGGRIAATALRGLWSLIGSGWTGRPAVGDWDGRLDGSWFACSPAAHLTIVNSRFQRTAHGQRHTIQACSPSRIEKKMIWARPTMFSNGT